MFHACAQRFDGMDEKILGGKLNRAVHSKKQNLFKISCHIEFYATCMHGVLNIDENKN